VDEAASLLAARLFHGGPAEPGPDWAPVGWQEYPEEVVDRKWRTDAARLHRVLDALGVRHSTDPTASDRGGPTLARVLEHLTAPPADDADAGSDAGSDPDSGAAAPTTGRRGAYEKMGLDEEDGDLALGSEGTAALAAGLSAELAREEAAAPAAGAEQAGPGPALWDDGMLPLFPLQPPRTGRELLADHVTAMVCCAAMDTAGALPGLDWLDGPSLLVDGERAADLGPRVLTLVEQGDPTPLREWIRHLGVRPEKPVRLV
jgi:hypothetical protein